ncbi:MULTISPECIES: hypothetical protein [Paraburkholderia]|nr:MULTISPECIES: hypothetical protein [Paraburkholderia]MBK3817545.1 hypothetical protein [Paraburkholderia aspalathi]MBK3829397.1 hypothetical protein [Paraburkholderia aspalathi]MBK3859082.1 hypothetical protein [Paraburkholderia aspalathi]
MFKTVSERGKRAARSHGGARSVQLMEKTMTSLSMARPGAFGKTAS